VTLRLLGSDDFPPEAERQAGADLTAAAAAGALGVLIGEPLPLERIAEAHDRVDAGAAGRVLLRLG
jgi:NADPH2:quinone reductase